MAKKNTGCKCEESSPYRMVTALTISTEERERFGENDWETVAGSLEVSDEVEGIWECNVCGETKKPKFEQAEKSALKLLHKFLDELAGEKGYAGRVVLDCNDDMTGGGLYIYDHKGREIMSWTEDEWKDDPTVPIAMCNALVVFYTQGEEALRKITGRSKRVG